MSRGLIRDARLTKSPTLRTVVGRTLFGRTLAGRRRAGVAGLAVALLGAGCTTWPFAEPAPPRPQLVVLLVVDQLRPDRLSPGQPDGLGRLQREGRVFSEAALDHAFSETCPGHVTAATGRYPSGAGIPGNRFVIEETLERVYCVLDRTPAGALVAAAPPEQIPRAPDAGRSPAMLRSDAIGDWLKAAFPSARVHSLSGKDRSAVALGGRRPDGAWWVDVQGSGALTTSRYYLSPSPRPAPAPDAPDASNPSRASDPSDPRLPEWAVGWTRERLLEGVPAQWIHPAHDPQGRIRDDDYFAETPWASRTSPHPLNQPEPPQEPSPPLPNPDQLLHSAPTNLPDAPPSSPPTDPSPSPSPPPSTLHDPARTGKTMHRSDEVQWPRVMPRVAASPYLDRRLLDVALDLVDAEELGRRRGLDRGRDGSDGRDRGVSAGADLLAIGLSATDLVGHLYGPFSQESRAALADLDEAIGELLAALEARLGRNRVGVVLTADHGVLPLPEWAQAVDLPENDCPVATGRVSEKSLIARLLADVDVAMSRAATRTGTDSGGADSGGAQRGGTRRDVARPSVAQPEGAHPRSSAPEVPELDSWLVVDGLRLHAHRARLEASGASLAQLDGAIRAAVADEPAIARVWSREALQAPFDPALAAANRDAVGARPRRSDDPAIPDTDTLRREHRLLSHSLVPGRAPDWVLVAARGCLITSRDHGTSHGSLHDYDRRIPLIFWGPGVEPGVDARPARLVDLAPTLARWLGLDPPEDLDGRVLPLVGDDE